MIVGEISNKVFVIDPDITLKKAAKIMSKKEIGSLVILKSGEILGIVTERDIIKNINSLKKKVSSIMAKEVITIKNTSEIEEASSLMHVYHIKRLPVVTEIGKLIGIVTLTDLIANSDLLNL
ncbi:MAG: CBS domain-containing protein [Nanoarchaeota archaeon]|nr:CBS domain-containing protein [Nanoarchaeota archaeon]MBU4086429.1 CBS domain-containing protein [Nanoarchaeota archaeon]